MNFQGLPSVQPQTPLAFLCPPVHALSLVRVVRKSLVVLSGIETRVDVGFVFDDWQNLRASVWVHFEGKYL